MNNAPMATTGRHDSLLQSLAPMQEAVVSLLRTHPRGLTEMALLKALMARPWQVLGPVDFSSPSTLYPVHFLLFHVLYCWRDALHRQTEPETLEIGPMSIRLRPLTRSGSNQPGAHDPLADFYRDLDNLALSDDCVEQMVNDFWRGVQPPDQGRLGEACQALEVPCPPPPLAQVRQQFRRLAMRHHPDRGGSTERLQALNEGMAVLRHYYRYQP
ncbi:MAG: DNA-J related domain-containing protein [Oleiphilaceae bacterium]|nr:DNA-J related domain-containing protein [Oleiphilaceae bacterium]